MNDATTDAATIFAPLWQRKWLILAVAILVGAGTYLYYKRQPATYTASTQLYLGGASEQQATLGSSQGKSTLSGRAVSDQVEIINSTVAQQVHKRLREEHNLPAARGKAKAKASASSDFITITSEARKPKAAAALANGYAQTYIKRQRATYLRNLRTSIANARAQLRRIEAPPPSSSKGSKGTTSSSGTIQAATLASRINQLETALNGFTGVQQVTPARANPLPVSPKPKQNAIFGFVLGLILAALAAYALSRLDRRVRSLADVEEIFHAPVLAALPKVRAPVVRRGEERGPARALVEPLRRLQTSLHSGAINGDRTNGPRVILFLSADAGDGRSTLIANLAQVQASGGERVAIVEADFRRPSQARLLDVSGPNGLAEVLAGKVERDVAMQRVKSTAQVPPVDSALSDGGVSTAVETERIGSVSVLLSGARVANPPALMAGEAMASLVRSLAEQFDSVLVDAPPPLEVSDVVPLLQLVDGLIIVARVGHTRDVSAQRLAVVLERTASAPVIGTVANCVPRKDMERYGFSWSPVRPRRRNLIGR